MRNNQLTIDQMGINLYRPNYFAGRYLDETDFEYEHHYLNDRLRYHHCSLHVAGIVEGLEVRQTSEWRSIRISPGAAIDQAGNLITLPFGILSLDLQTEVNGTLYLCYRETDDGGEQQEDQFTVWQNNPVLIYVIDRETELVVYTYRPEGRQYGLDQSLEEESKRILLMNAVKLCELAIVDGQVQVTKRGDYSGVQIPSAAETPITLRAGGQSQSEAVLEGSLSVTGSLTVNSTVFLKGSQSTTGLSVNTTGNVGIAGATNPSIHLAIGDNDTGFKQQGENVLAVYTNNTERMRVAADGNVGIGTTSSRARLDVQSATRTGNNHPTAVKGLYVTGDFGADSDGVEFRKSDASEGIGFGSNTIYAAGSNTNQSLNLKPKGTGNVTVKNGDLLISKPTAQSDTPGQIVGQLSFVGFNRTVNSASIVAQSPSSDDQSHLIFSTSSSSTGATEKLRITHDGKVGIGTNDPKQNFVLSSGKAGIGYNEAAQTADLAVSGNVGIGTTTPESKLHIDKGRVDITASDSPGGGQTRFNGLLPYAEGAMHRRSQLVISSGYSDLIIASSHANNNHGSTLTFATYNPTNATEYRKWVVGQGNWGTGDNNRKHFLEFGYADAANPNPHDYISAANTVLTLDGISKRVGIGTRTPTAQLEVGGTLTATTNDATLTAVHIKPTFSIASFTGVKQNGLIVERGNVGIGTTTPGAKLAINGGLHVGGDSDPGNDNLEVDGTTTLTGNLTVKSTVNLKGSSTTTGLSVDTSGNVSMGSTLTVAGNIFLKNVAETGSKLLLTNWTSSHYIRANGWWTEFVSHPNQGWKFISAGGGTDSETTANPHTRMQLSGSGLLGLSITPALTANDNSATLSAVVINPTFNENSKTGVRKNGLIVESGNVGIGTTSPNGFQVVLPESSARPGAGVTISGGSTGNAKIELRNNGTGTPFIDFAQDASTDDYDARIRLADADTLAIEDASLTVSNNLTVSGSLTISTGGNAVNVGTTLTNLNTALTRKADSNSLLEAIQPMDRRMQDMDRRMQDMDRRMQDMDRRMQELRSLFDGHSHKWGLSWSTNPYGN